MLTALSTITAGTLELDGGAMFGVVPRTVWARAYPPAGDHNRCVWAMRCLLAEFADGRKVIIDTGVGAKDGPQFRKHFNPQGSSDLTRHLRQRPLHPEEITDVLFTHLHFDHVGGASYVDAEGRTRLTFPNATHWVCGAQWRWARRPNAREAASFLSANLDPLDRSGKLRLLPAQDSDYRWCDGLHLRTVYGHTEAMQLPLFDLPGGRRVVYCADLIPSAAHLSLPWVMAYDVRPLSTLAEKERLLHEAHAGDWTLLFEHDRTVAGGRLGHDERGRTVLVDALDSFAFRRPSAG